MKASEALIKAKELISKPENWTTIEYARTVEGVAARGDFSDANCFCTLGAMLHSQGKKVSAPEGVLCGMQYLKQSCSARGYPLVSDFNDVSTHVEVLEMFDDAIKLAIEDGE